MPIPMNARKEKTESTTSRLTIRIPDDWRPHLQSIAQGLSAPGRAPTLADAVRALVVDGLAARGVKVTSVVGLKGGR